MKNSIPTFFTIGDEFSQKIANEAKEILNKIGVNIKNVDILELLYESGAKVEKDVAFIPEKLLDEALKTVPQKIEFWDLNAENSAILEGNSVHFVPQAGAINIWDYDKKIIRKPFAGDCVEYIKIMNELDGITFQCTGHYPAGIPPELSSAYRVYLCLKYGHKPFWGTMIPKKQNIEIVKELLKTARGCDENLMQRPITFFSCSPTSPLTWDDDPLNTLIEASKSKIPVAIVPSPTVGVTSPIKLEATITQTIAEQLSGLMISQLINPGAPVILGVAPETFDMQRATTSMGSIESVMISVAVTEVVKKFGAPSLNNTGIGDSKRNDSQSGIEAGTGMMLSAISGTNIVIGPGGLNQCLTASHEKLIIDNEICRMVKRMLAGYDYDDDKHLASDIFDNNVMHDKNYLSYDSTLKYFKSEVLTTSQVIDRGDISEWELKNKATAEERANEILNEIRKIEDERKIDPHIDKDITRIIQTFARQNGLYNLPDLY